MPSRRSDGQKLVERLLSEANRGVDTGTLRDVFGSTSPEHVLRVMLRIKHLKKRDKERFSDERVEMYTIFPKRLKEHRDEEKRKNVHHLTPQCRKDQPFHGNNRHNFLLMRISRHDALHKAFGVKTWEEIIILLSRCAIAARNMDFNTMIDLIVRSFKKSDRRKARRALRNLQLDLCPGIYSGASLVGPQGIEPCLTAPKAVVLPVYDGPSRPFKVSYFWFRINASNDIVRFALVVQWIEQSSSKALM